MATAITFGGLASGIDTNSIVDKLVAAERIPINTLQQQRQDAATRKTLIGDIVTKLNSLSTTFSAMNTQVAVQGRAVDVATAATYSAEVAGGAPVGTYNIQVNQLARAQRTYSNTAADPAATGAYSGSVTVSIGATSTVIALDGTDSLNSIASKLNGSGLRLGAAVVYDGANYRLVVNGSDTGSANAISFVEAGTTPGFSVPANTVVSASNAQLTIDGLSVTSATNVLNGSIAGVTLTLKGTSATPTTMTVRQDPERLKTSLKATVEAYNATMTIVNKQFATDGKSQLGADTLAGDSVARQLQATMLGIATVRGGPAGGTFTSLAEIGINIDRYGIMTLDESRLATATNRDPAAVSNLLAGTDGTNGLMKKLGDSLKTFTDFVDGTLPNKQKTIDTRIKTIDDDIARMETAAVAYEQGLRQQFLQMEQLIASFQSQTSALTAQLSQSSNNR